MFADEQCWFHIIEEEGGKEERTGEQDARESEAATAPRHCVSLRPARPSGDGADDVRASSSREFQRSQGFDPRLCTSTTIAPTFLAPPARRIDSEPVRLSAHPGASRRTGSPTTTVCSHVRCRGEPEQFVLV